MYEGWTTLVNFRQKKQDREKEKINDTDKMHQHQLGHKISKASNDSKI